MSAPTLGHQVIRASAGSGKTHRLTNRYLGLLAAGREVNSILATTFTRKAAGEIVRRVLTRLADAAAYPAKAMELAHDLKTVGEPRPDFTLLLRTLLSNLHRLRIGTLDSFTMALAGSFSFELGLPSHWAICEEVDNAALYDDALERVLAQQSGAIGTLLPLLYKGETTRTVFTNLRDVVQTHYEIYGDSERLAWEGIQIPSAVPEADRRLARSINCASSTSAFANTRASHKHAKKTSSASRTSSGRSFSAMAWPKKFAMVNRRTNASQFRRPRLRLIRR